MVTLNSKVEMKDLNCQEMNISWVPVICHNLWLDNPKPHIL